MRRISFIEPDPKTHSWFEGWKETAKRKTKEVIDAVKAGNKPTFDQKLWSGDVKAFLTSLTNGNCAYCEARYPHVSPGDVEHFRPKAGVEGEPAHLGYYWLAYQLRNMLASCEYCNRYGKRNHFPLETETRAYTHDEDISFERPILIDLYSKYEQEDPENHIDFKKPEPREPRKKERDYCFLGDVVGKSKRGVKVIKILGLDREQLVRDRGSEQKKLHGSFLRHYYEGTLSELIDEIRKGEWAYTSALKSALRFFINEEIRIAKEVHESKLKMLADHLGEVESI